MRYKDRADVLEAIDTFIELNPDKSNYSIARVVIEQFDLKETAEAIRQFIARRKVKIFADKEIIEQNVKLAKQKQKQQDTNRIERKSFREYARIENAVSEFGKQLLDQYKQYGENLTTTFGDKKVKYSKAKKGTLVIQLTDVHGNELIDLPHNKFDFDILSRRLKLFIEKAKQVAKGFNVKNIAFISTGDLLNSDRRKDELLNQATNRSKSTMLMQSLIVQAILDIRSEGYNVTVAGVLGNEARVGQEMPFSKSALSDNYDFVIMEGVKKILSFSKIKGIKFGPMDQVEQVINIDGKNWLCVHDMQKATSQQAKAQSTIGRYSLQGIKIDYILGGHVHATRITDFSSRSGSMSGSNSYNEVALNLGGSASQNLYVAQDSTITPIRIDLQKTDHIKGYDIIEELKAYNIKSTSKLYVGTTTFRVVI